MTQDQALKIMESGVNVFLTGAPGAGKTYTLNKFISQIEKSGKRVAITASTGIAATHIGGLTIHSWSGIGIKDELTKDDKAYISASESLRHRFRSTDVLIIDEISMLHGFRLDLVNEVACLLRDSQQPFGGIQVILVGDFFQLPPISQGSDDMIDFLYNSKSWHELDLHICYLTEQHRQAQNDGLLSFLDAMRNNTVSDSQLELIKSRIGLAKKSDKVITKLYSHNFDVDSVNKRQLEQLDGKMYSFTAKTTGQKYKVEQLLKNILSPKELDLKINAEVMFVVNNFSEGYVNGSRGRVVGFNTEQPVVKLENGREVRVSRHKWTLQEDGEIIAQVEQMPLRLAWAITIHKSQGMSLDAAEIDLSRAFTPGMGYVAISRVKSLDGLYLTGLNNMALVLNPKIYDLDFSLKQFSLLLTNQFDPDTDDLVKTISQNRKLINQELFQLLLQWRSEISQNDDDIVFNIPDSILEIVAALKPINILQLSSLPGWGKRMIKKYGQQVVGIIKEYQIKSFQNS